MRIFGSMLVAAASVAGCNRSSPPAVAVAPVEVGEAKPAPIVGQQAAPAANAERIPDGGTFVFPDDAEGMALARTLTPGTPAPMPAAVPIAPKSRRLPAFLDDPAPPLFDAAGSLPMLPLPVGQPFRPTLLPERVPPDFGSGELQLPEREKWPTGPLAHEEKRDLDRPIELPILSAHPVADRAPLIDPTLEFTARSVISKNLPLRTEPTGFLRINLPDPFERAKDAKPRTPVVENPNRSLSSPPPPK